MNLGDEMRKEASNLALKRLGARVRSGDATDAPGVESCPPPHYY